jgi:hypothetical protein
MLAVGPDTTLALVLEGFGMNGFLSSQLSLSTEEGVGNKNGVDRGMEKERSEYDVSMLGHMLRQLIHILCFLPAQLVTPDRSLDKDRRTGISTTANRNIKCMSSSNSSTDNSFQFQMKNEINPFDAFETAEQAVAYEREGVSVDEGGGDCIGTLSFQDGVFRAVAKEMVSPTRKIFVF